MRIFFLLIFCLPCLLFSQKSGIEEPVFYPVDQRVARSSYQSFHLGKDASVEHIRSYITGKLENLGYPNTGLKLLHEIESPGGRHFTFHQTYQGTGIFRSMVKVNMDKKGNIQSIFDNSYPVPEKLSETFPVTTLATEYLQDRNIETDKLITENTYYYDGESLIPALRVEVLETSGRYYELILNGAGKMIYFHDLTSYFSPPPDSVVTATVFIPDPLPSANTTYGSPYSDNNDNDATQLTNELVTVNMTVTFTAGTFSLESPYVKITEHWDPVITPVTSTSPDFSFTRSQSGFEDVNVYYHIHTFQEYIQSLGFSNIVNYQINADTHGWNGQDQSNFNPGFSPARLTFGEGGVDDAEDADVIIHEYGHAISNSAAPGTNSGTERQALDEALGDYLASSYSRSMDPYKWENVFSWDGHNEFWSGRSSISSKTYPNDLNFNLYLDADIWSATMMQIWGDIGRQETDKVLIQSLYSYSSGMTMSDAAWLVVLADSSLNNGLYHQQICDRFDVRGLLSFCALGLEETSTGSSPVRLLNSLGFMNGGHATLKFNHDNDPVIRLYDALGRTIIDESFRGNEYLLNSTDLSAGVYLLRVTTGDKVTSFKLIRQ